MYWQRQIARDSIPTVSPSRSLKEVMAGQTPPSSPLETSVQKALAVTKDFRERAGSKAMIAICNNYAVFAVCITLAQCVSGRPHVSTSMSRTLYLLSTLIIASRMRALEILVHEASHNNLFSSACLHQKLQFLYAFPVFRLVQDYRKSHMIHHKYLGDPEKDPDILRLYKLGLDRLPERPIWYLLGVPVTGFLIYEHMTTTFYEFWKSPTSRLSKTAFWAGVMLALHYSGALRHFIYYYLVPFLVILPITRYWAEASEHLGLNITGGFGSSRTNIGFFHKWYMNPHNDGYHAVHHLCSQIPFYVLPEAHQRLISASEEFERRSVVSFGMLETFMQMATRETVVKDVSGSGKSLRPGDQ